MRQVVGIDRKIKRAWLDATLDRLAQGKDEAELRTFLDKHLKDELPGQASRAKSIGIILRIWSGIPRERLALRDRAIALLPKISGQERVWLHWGMAAVAYPFFRDTAEVVGRLLTLQDDFTTAHVQARMLTTWGDRATCREAAQKLVTMLVDWEVLRATKTKGHFLLARQMTASIPELQLWLLESLLWASAADEIEAQQLLRLPESFPFQFNVGLSDLRKHEGFNIHRQGLDMDMVALRKIKLEPPPKPAKKPSKKKKDRPEQPNLFDRQSEETLSSNGKPTADPIPPKPRSTKKTKPTDTDERRSVEEAIKSEVLRTLSDRADRFLQVRGTILVPDGPFAAPSIECAEQFRDGHYFGCIALTQAVLEAVIRHIWQVKLKKKSNQEGSFDKNLAALHKKNFISDEWKTKLNQMWADRHSFHHLRPSVESDHRKLEETARNTLLMLNDLEQEFFDVHFSYIDMETMEEKFISVPEQGGGSLIPDGPLNPGVMHTIATGSGGHLGLYRLETQVTAGNGSLKMSGLGSNSAAKEGIKVGFDYFKANAHRVSASIKPGDHDYHLHVVELHNTGPNNVMTLASFVALCSGVFGKPLQQQMVVLGSMSLSGSIVPVENLAETLQVAFDAGAKRILLPMASVKDIPTIPGELFAKFQTGFYADPVDAVFKALGVQ